MYLVQVDDRLPEVVLLLVEVPHTNLTEVTGMVLFSIVSIDIRLRGGSYRKSRESVEPCPCWYGGGADHQPDHDHPDACGACQHDRVRERRGRDCEENLLAFIAYLNFGYASKIRPEERRPYKVANSCKSQQESHRG